MLLKKALALYLSLNPTCFKVGLIDETNKGFITNYVPGNPDLPAELLQTLLKMAPTTEEELKLRLFSGDLSQLGPAERFLKVLVDVPFAFKRLECLLFMLSMSEDVTNIKESFATLKVSIPRSKINFLKLNIQFTIH